MKRFTFDCKSQFFLSYNKPINHNIGGGGGGGEKKNKEKIKQLREQETKE